MKVKVLREAGYTEALLGLSLSYSTPIARMPEVARRLVGMGGSHAKFLESIAVWLDVTAPRYFWQQFDTYRIGITKQSESTMHTIMRPDLNQEDFEPAISSSTLKRLDQLRRGGFFKQLKAELPESFLQRRIVCANYKALQHIISQRHDHRLSEWQVFCNSIWEQVEYPEFVGGFDAE